jgi:hypothetical protein
METDKVFGGNLLPLSIKDIAKQVNDPNCRDQVKRITLPKLQRGRVWKPHQVEQLWDSLLQGFPIGSFLIMPFSPEQKRDEHADYHLLDGQQRMNAIALAFDGPGKSSEERPEAALWIDLEKPPFEDTHGRQFVFRVVTFSHPWGYDRMNPQKRLSASNMRQAIAEFKKGTRDHKALGDTEWKPGKIPLRLVWPWDGTAPVPFNLLIRAIEEAGAKEDERGILDKLIDLLSELPFWDKDNPPWKTVLILLKNPPDHVGRIVESTRSLLDDQQSALVPALIVQPCVKQGHQNSEASDAARTDSIETLFARFNTGGTPLGEEELIYSILKIIWPDAYDLIEGKDGLKKIIGTAIAPARLVMLTVRVALADLNKLNKDTFPAVQKVRDFRKRMHEPDFRKLLTDRYLKGHRMRTLLDETMRLLKWGRNSNHEKADLRFPTFLISDVAHSSPDLLLLLLVWLDRHIDREQIALSNEKHKLLLAALTTLHWFSNDRKRCLDELWKNVNYDLWEPGMLTVLITTGEMLPALYPPLPSQELSSAIDKRMNNWKRDKLDPNLSLWTHLTHEAPDWYRTNDWNSDSNKARNAWSRAVEVSFHRRELLLYAQRQGIAKLFQDFDATGLDRLEDFDLPWDYDHILPSSYVHGKHKVHQIIKDLVNSIGNLRVWPMECNRSDKIDPPSFKLGQVTDMERPYKMGCGEDIRDASLIDDKNWVEWQVASPKNNEISSRYLSTRDDLHGEHCDKLVDAIPLCQYQ